MSRKTEKDQLTKMLSHFVQHNTESASEYLTRYLEMKMHRKLNESVADRDISVLYVGWNKDGTLGIEFSGDADEVKDELRDLKDSGSYEKGVKTKIIKYKKGETIPKTISA